MFLMYPTEHLRISPNLEARAQQPSPLSRESISDRSMVSILERSLQWRSSTGIQIPLKSRGRLLVSIVKKRPPPLEGQKFGAGGPYSSNGDGKVSNVVSSSGF